MLQRILFVFTFLISFTLQAQVGGSSVYQFLSLTSSPRQAALGGKSIANYDYDVNQALYNPATINAEMTRRIGLTYVNYLSDVNYGSLSYAFRVKDSINIVHAGVTYVNYGKFDGRDEFGDQTASFTGSETAVSVGYATRIPDTKIQVGLNVKAVSSVLETYKSFGLVGDLGLLYQAPSKRTVFTAVARNFGSQLSTYNGVKEKTPFEVLAGFSHELENLPVRFNFTLENLQKWNVAFSNPARNEETIDGQVKEEKVTDLGNAFRHVIVGAEIMPRKAISFRLSYNFRRAAELKIIDQRTLSGFSGGFGVRFNKFRLDYSYSRFTLASNTSQFGFMLLL